MSLLFALSGAGFLIVAATKADNTAAIWASAAVFSAIITTMVLLMGLIF